MWPCAVGSEGLVGEFQETAITGEVPDNTWFFCGHQIHDLLSSSSFSQIWVASTVRCNPAGEGWSLSHLLNFQDLRGHSQSPPGGQLTGHGCGCLPSSVWLPRLWLETQYWCQGVRRGEGFSTPAAPVPQPAIQVSTPYQRRKRGMPEPWR